jgi:S1-C subfamily serine protease
VTCAHVAEALDIQKPGTKYEYSIVTMDGKRHAAKLVAKNSANDIALMKFEGKDLAHFDLGEDRTPKKGDHVMALGFPMGNIGLGRLPEGKDSDVLVHPSLAIGGVVEGSVPFYIMSPGVKKYYPDAVESDTPVFMGDSGGPLVNRKGELIGLNAAIIPASNKTYSLSVASIRTAYETLKDGKDIEGSQPEAGDAIQRLGKTLWDAFGSNFSLSEAEPARPYLFDPFKKMAETRKSGVVRLFRGDKPFGYATLIDEKGNAITSLHVVDKSSYLDKIVSEIDKRAEENDTLRELWDMAKGMLEENDEIFAQLPDGRKVAVEVKKKAAAEKIALLHLSLPKDFKTSFIPKMVKGARGPGQWVVAVGSNADVLGVGLLSTDHHTVRGAMRIPGSIREAWDVFTKDSKGIEGNDLSDVILHDVPLRYSELGSPLLDSDGRLIGVNVYHVCRGVSYAVPVSAALKALGVDSGM